MNAILKAREFRDPSIAAVKSQLELAVRKFAEGNCLCINGKTFNTGEVGRLHLELQGLFSSLPIRTVVHSRKGTVEYLVSIIGHSFTLSDVTVSFLVDPASNFPLSVSSFFAAVRNDSFHAFIDICVDSLEVAAQARTPVLDRARMFDSQEDIISSLALVAIVRSYTALKLAHLSRTMEITSSFVPGLYPSAFALPLHGVTLEAALDSSVEKPHFLRRLGVRSSRDAANLPDSTLHKFVTDILAEDDMPPVEPVRIIDREFLDSLSIPLCGRPLYNS